MLQVDGGKKSDGVTKARRVFSRCLIALHLPRYHTRMIKVTAPSSLLLLRTSCWGVQLAKI